VEQRKEYGLEKGLCEAQELKAMFFLKNDAFENRLEIL
jgi:hypothetical protein